MIRKQLEGANFVVANTDAQALEHSVAPKRIQLGRETTKGLGAGASPDVGRYAAEETMDEIKEHLQGSNMVFITAGMGGGTGTGAAPVVARAAREMDILTVAVVTKPFQFEGPKRMKMAEEGLRELQQNVDTLLIIPNQNLFRVANERTTFAEAFAMADDVLHAGVRSITDLMVMPGLINLDFADVRAVMTEMGKAMMGTGEADGDRRAYEAAEAAISNPLLDNASMKGARGVLINITGGSDMTLFEVDEAANRIREEVDNGANIIFGSTFDDTMEGGIRVSVVATGIDREGEDESSSGGSTTGQGGERQGEQRGSAYPATPAAAAPRQEFQQRKPVAPQPAAQAPQYRQPAAPQPSPYSRNAYRSIEEESEKQNSTRFNQPQQAPQARPYGGDFERQEAPQSPAYAAQAPKQEEQNAPFRTMEPSSYREPVGGDNKFRGNFTPERPRKPVAPQPVRQPQQQPAGGGARSEDEQGGLLSRVAKMARSLQPAGEQGGQAPQRRYTETPNNNGGYQQAPSYAALQQNRPTAGAGGYRDANANAQQYQPSHVAPKQEPKRNAPHYADNAGGGYVDPNRRNEAQNAPSLFDKPGDVSRQVSDIPAFMRKNNAVENA